MDTMQLQVSESAMTTSKAITKLYSKLYGTSLSSVIVPGVCLTYSYVNVKGKQLGSCKSRSEASSLVLAINFGQSSLLC